MRHVPIQLIAILASVGLVAAACAPAAGGGGVTGKVSVYSALNESTNNAFVDAFKKSYPAVQVDVLPLAAAGELQTRITTEKARPKADIFIGGAGAVSDPPGKKSTPGDLQ